jgi:hypothetical protein
MRKETKDCIPDRDIEIKTWLYSYSTMFMQPPNRPVALVLPGVFADLDHSCSTTNTEYSDSGVPSIGFFLLRRDDVHLHLHQAAAL